MNLAVDAVAVGSLLLCLVWGFTAGWWLTFVVSVSLLVGILLAARTDAGLGHALHGLGPTSSAPILDAFLFTLVTVVACAIAGALLSALLGFWRPTTRAAHELPSARIFGSLFGLVTGFLLLSLVFESLYLATTAATAGTALVTLHHSLAQAEIAPRVWSLVHAEDWVFGRIFSLPSPPPFKAP
ncbi:MAG: CvpA family protein [Chloroflexi bacterium]|nr:CvpA family protein [Chloroflexota bacterium]